MCDDNSITAAHGEANGSLILGRAERSLQTGAARDFRLHDNSLILRKLQAGARGLVQNVQVPLSAHDSARGMTFEIQQEVADFMSDV